MMNVILWIFAAIDLIFGFVIYNHASNMQIWYTLSGHSEIAGVLKFLGVVCIISGIVFIFIPILKKIYTNKHVQDAAPHTEKGGFVKCLNCGLTVTANTSVCPGCGHAVGYNKPNNILPKNRPAFESALQNSPMEMPAVGFCSSCGCKIESPDEYYCINCGNKIR
ncbi:MAG: hypothetical protein LUH47_05095 [Clostridiales bacterium]|nr:hypothetical protein [Clostridiales bacterium]